MKATLCRTITGLLLITPAFASFPTTSAATPTQEPAAQEQKLPSAAEVIARYKKVSEFEEGLKKHRSYDVKGEVQIASMGIGGTYNVSHARPNKMRMLMTLDGMGETRVGYNGEILWTIHAMMGPTVAEGLEYAQQTHLMDFAREEYADGYFQEMKTVEKVQFEGKDCYRVRLLLKPFKGLDKSDAETLKFREIFEYFDAETGHKIGVEMVQASMMGPTPVKIVYGEPQRYNGVLMPSKTVQHVQGIQLEMTVDQVVFDEVKPETFAIPKEIQSILDRKKAKAKPGEEPGQAAGQ